MAGRSQHGKFNKSKIVIKDQWASHPTTEERVLALEKINKLRAEAGKAEEEKTCATLILIAP